MCYLLIWQVWFDQTSVVRIWPPFSVPPLVYSHTEFKPPESWHVPHKFCVWSEGVSRYIKTPFLQLTVTGPAVCVGPAANWPDGCVLLTSPFIYSSVYCSLPSRGWKEAACHSSCVMLVESWSLSQSHAILLTFSWAASIMEGESWSW